MQHTKYIVYFLTYLKIILPKKIEEIYSEFTIKTDAKDIIKINKIHKKLDQSYKTHKYIFPVCIASVTFETVESAIIDDMKILRRKIEKLYKKRIEDINKIKKEIEKIQNIIKFDTTSFPIDIKKGNGKLTDSGIEFCHKLFTIEASDVAISHIMQLSLKSITQRRESWRSLTKSQK